MNHSKKLLTAGTALLIIVCSLSAIGVSPPPGKGIQSQFPDTSGCTYKGFKLYGKIQVVDSWPDVKVKIVESFPDLKVKVVENWPDDCGEWQFVDNWPDLEVQFVESFPDIKVKFVENWPGKP